MQLPGKVVSPEEVIFPMEVPELSYGASSEIVGASSAVKLEYNEQQGRHLTHSHCIISKQNNPNIPSDPSFSFKPKQHQSMLYCSSECQTEAEQKYHNVECIPYCRFRCINFNTHMDVSDAICRIIRLFSIIGINNLQPYFKYVRTQYVTDNKTKLDSNGIFDSTNFDAIFNLFSSKHMAVQTDLLMSSAMALPIPRCFGLSTEHPDFFAIAGLFVHLELIAAANCPSKCYTNFLNPPKKIVQPALCFNPLKSLINHSCLIGNVATVHYGNKQVIMAKWPIKRGSVLTEPYMPLHHEWSKEERQKYLKAHCGFDCKCIVCEENWDFIHSKRISDPVDQELASELFDYNEGIVIDIHRCYLRNVLTSELQKFVKDRRDLLTKLWSKGEFLDVYCLEMQSQLEVYQYLQGNRIMYMIDYSQQVVQDPASVAKKINSHPVCRTQHAIWLFLS
ncbi:hypothetical protein B566_EDAN013132, partial [Ephemera danica]